MKEVNVIIQGDALKVLRKIPSDSIDCIITSPPYWGIRDYGVKGQLGLERSVDKFLDNMLKITAECQRVLKKGGTMFWDHGDNYAGSWGDYAPNGIKNQQRKQTVKGKRWNRPAYKGKNGLRPPMSFKQMVPDKSLMLQAHRLAIRMVDEQKWILRNTIIWHKPNAMPSSIKDRFGVDFEPIFFFVKSKRYYFDQQFEDRVTEKCLDDTFNMRVRDVARGKIASDQYKASDSEVRKYSEQKDYGGGGTGLRKMHDMGIDSFRDDGKRGVRCVWKIPAKPFSQAHFATFPEELIQRMLLAGCPRGGVVLDPFMGAGTTAAVARKLERNFLGIELNPKYVAIANKRLSNIPTSLFAIEPAKVGAV